MKTQTFIIALMILMTWSTPSAQTNAKISIVGTWDQLSSEFTLFDGSKGKHTKETATRIDLFNDTHWMRIAHRDGKFEYASGGTYVSENNKLKLMVLYSSNTDNIGFSFELICRIEGKKLFSDGTTTNRNGETMTWHDVFEKAEMAAPVKN